MKRIIRARYPVNAWNIYGAQASDGDNVHNDKDKCVALMNELLPLCQYYAYIEVANSWMAEYGGRPGPTTLWTTYESIRSAFQNLAMRKIAKSTDIPPVFVDLFRRRQPGRAAAFTAGSAFGAPAP